MARTEIDEEFLTVAEVAEMLKLNQQTVRNWIDQGSLPALHVGRSVRIQRSDFDAFIERGYTGRSESAGKPERVEGVWSGEIPPPVLPDPVAVDDDRR